ncbi:hypothetical protein FZCC0069_01480 [Rhodobacterales bacterium FZCC0069]|nr:hypothetical protein [Rhodobacterales bacterium FZCC0069]
MSKENTPKPSKDAAAKPKRAQDVYTLVVELGRREGDGLPASATGAELLCYASGVDEAEAVRETVAVLKTADMNPLEVTGYGTLTEREAQGLEIDEEERALMMRALEENSVIVAQMTPYFAEDDET